MPTFKPMDEWTLRLADRMATKIRTNSFMHVTVLGERNYGKTYYCFKNMALTLYRTFEDMREIDAWYRVLDYVVFTLPYFKKIVKHCRENDYKVPFILLDDAGSHFDSGLWSRSQIQYQMLNTCLDTIKDVTNCLMVTCPFKEVLTNRLQKYDGYDVTLYMDNGYERRGTCIKWYRLPSGRRQWDKKFEDNFSCYIPTPIHEKYLEMRNKFTLGHLDELDILEERALEIKERKKKKRLKAQKRLKNGET